MKIGKNMPLIAKAVELFNKSKVDLVLHAGDIISPITFKEFKLLKCKGGCEKAGKDSCDKSR